MSFTNEQLKAKQEAWQARRGNCAVPVPVENVNVPDYAALKAYAKKVNQGKDNKAQVLKSIHAPTIKPSPISYEDGRTILWDIMKGFALQFPEQKFLVDEYNRDLIQNLLRYFLGLPGQFDNRKGIFITGGTGLGKTVLMRIFSKFTQIDGVLHRFQYYDSAVIYRDFRQTQDIALDFYKSNNICIDDLGKEPLIYKSFGNEIMPMVDILDERHKRWDRGADNSMTFITSNLTIDEIANRYGNRIGDRFKMFNLIQMNGPSRR